MKKYFVLLLVFSYLHSFGQIVFTDENLEKGIRENLGINNSTQITQTLLNSLISLNLDGYGIENLTGIEYCANLKDISLINNSISNVARLNQLSQLQNINLEDNNISYIGSLSALRNCRIVINQNYISNTNFIDASNVVEGLNDQKSTQKTGNTNFYLRSEILDLSLKIVRFHYRSGSDLNNNAILNVGDKRISGDPWDFGLYNIISDGQSRYVDHTFRNLGQYTAFLYFSDPNSSSNKVSHIFSLAQQINFTITSTATNICTSEPITLTASGCSGTLQWNENLGNQSSVTTRPSTSKNYYADCLYSGTSKRSNSISVTVKPGPTIAPKIENNYSQINRGESVVLIASGCPTGTNYYWKDFSAWDRITFYPTESDTYTAYCTLNGCNGPEAQTIVNVLDINCEIAEPNNSASSAYTLFEFKDKLVSTKLINGEEYPEYLGLGRFCIKNPTDNVDWYKIKIHEKWYYLKLSINGNNCPECIYKLRFQVDGGLLTIYSYLYTNGETAKVEVYDSNTTALLASQNFNSSTEHELQVNICKSMPVPLIDFSQLSLNNLYTCHPNYFGLHVTHPIYEMGKGNLNSVAYNIGFSWSENMDGSNELNEGTYYFTPNLNSQKTYYVRGSDRNTPGCIGETALPITVYPNQSPSTPIPTVTVSKTEVSLGESIILKATGCPSIVKWNALPILVQDNITAEVQYGEEIIYKPVLRSFDSQISNTYYARCITETCIGSGGGSPRVTVYRINKPVISSNKSNVCPGESVSLTATGCTNGIITWNNYLGSGTSKTANPSITTTYSATCTLNGATTDFADGVTVFVNIFSGGSISPITQNLCQNINSSTNRLLDQPLSLTNYIGNILRWEYKPPNGTWTNWGQAGIEIPSNCCFGGIVGTWKVRAIIGNETCTSVTSEESSIVVLPNPSATLSGTQTITQGQTASISVGLTGTAPWTIVMNGSSYTANATPFSIPVNPNISTTYNLSSVNNNCGAGIVSGSAVITVSPACVLPSATLTTANQTITYGQAVNLSVNLTGTPPLTFIMDGITYTGINLSPYTYNISKVPLSTKTYTVSSITNNCGTGTASGSTTVTVNIQSIAYTSPTGGNYSFGQSLPITYSSSDGTGTVNLDLVSCSGTTVLSTIVINATSSGTINYAIPSSLPDGSYRIRAHRNGVLGFLYYSSCFNYYACGTLPDIIISDVAITKYAANRVNYAVTVKNTSISPASLGSVSLGVFASPDALRNSNDIIKSTIFAGGGTLQPGQTYVINDFSSFNFADPNYYLGFSIDYHGLLTECYESNNDFIKLVNKCNASGTDIVLGFLSDPFYALNGTVIVPSTNHYTTPKMIVARAFKVNPTTNLTNLSLVVGNCLTLPSGARIGVSTPIEEKHISLGNFDYEYNSLKITEVRNEVVKVSIWDVYNNQLIKVVTPTEIQDLEKLELKTGKYLLRLESPTLMEGFVFER